MPPDFSEEEVAAGARALSEYAPIDGVPAGFGRVRAVLEASGAVSRGEYESLRERTDVITRQEHAEVIRLIADERNQARAELKRLRPIVRHIASLTTPAKGYHSIPRELAEAARAALSRPDTDVQRGLADLDAGRLVSFGDVFPDTPHTRQEDE